MLNKKLLFTLFACLFLVIGSVDAQYGNTKKKKKKKSKPKTEKEKDRGSLSDRDKEEESTFKEKLWIGANVQNIGFSNNTFSFGIAPKVGYDVISNLSVGAMVKLVYISSRITDFSGNRIGSVSTFDIGPTIFTRYNFLEQFFVQAEFERASFERPIFPYFRDDKGRFLTERYGENYAYIGAGYGGGYPFSSYFSVHYNVLDDPLTSTRMRFDVRFSFNYHF